MHPNRLALACAAGCLFLTATLSAQAGETPVDPASLDSGAGSPGLSNGAAGSLIVNGFAVASYDANLTTRENTFSPDALALSLYDSVTDGVSLFTQLTTAREAKLPFVDAEDPGDATADIDNLQIRWVPDAASGLDVVFGKFDSPLAIERDDAPLNFQATSSFTFDFTRPVKFTGVQIHEAFAPSLEGWAIVSNGADLDTDNNKSKTAALYGVWSPSLAAHAGLGVIRGDEQAGDSSHARTTMVGTLLMQPTARTVWGGEGVAGEEEGLDSDGRKARWSALSLFAHHRFAGRWAGTVRAEVVRDRNGARTGTAQTLSSLTLSPQYLVGGGFYGVFRYLDRTSLRLPQFALRLDLRGDRSTAPVFQSRDETSPGRRDHFSLTLQTVVVF